MKHVLTVNYEERGRTLVELLVHRLRLSAEQAASCVRAGSVYVDERRQSTVDLLLRPGQRIVAHLREHAPAHLPSPTTVYLDDDVAVLDKPAGLLSTLDRTGGSATVQRFAEQELGREARLLHRLDREASGLLLVTRTVEARRCLAAELVGHTMVRRYFAIVQGEPVDSLLLDAPLDSPVVISGRLAVAHGRSRSTTDPRARYAETHLRCLRRLAGGRRLLEVELKTGRTHQIRAHLAERGLPILGDARYGGSPAERLALHAHEICFRHPARDEWLEIHSPLPTALVLIAGDRGD